MTTVYAYTSNEPYLRAAAVASKRPWAYGPYGDRGMAQRYYQLLKPYGPLRLKRIMSDNETGYALVLGESSTTLRTFRCPPFLFRKIPNDEAYTLVVTPDYAGNEVIPGLQLVFVGVVNHNTPLKDDE
ncbi:hypothetical protein RhiJN_07051 [Ceratobasidium sp. AG-Ba]|nr:hypothetical protein RhiJN_07051 [Ceratobasidium sp. AG-Ba]QRW07935.1 hypothetical protein RhiLY_06934 [Ceratobasidium sp. AG-Ba]